MTCGTGHGLTRCRSVCQGSPIAGIGWKSAFRTMKLMNSFCPKGWPRKFACTKHRASRQEKHSCNCCGHYLWNVGIIRRSKIPRKQLSAVYFRRENENSECPGCEAFADICPVDAVMIQDDRSVVHDDWCICGGGNAGCPAEGICIVRLDDRKPPQTFFRIRVERSI